MICKTFELLLDNWSGLRDNWLAKTGLAKSKWSWSDQNGVGLTNEEKGLDQDGVGSSQYEGWGSWGAPSLVEAR